MLKITTFPQVHLEFSLKSEAECSKLEVVWENEPETSLKHRLTRAKWGAKLAKLSSSRSCWCKSCKIERSDITSKRQLPDCIKKVPSSISCLVYYFWAVGLHYVGRPAALLRHCASMPHHSATALLRHCASMPRQAPLSRRGPIAAPSLRGAPPCQPYHPGLKGAHINERKKYCGGGHGFRLLPALGDQQAAAAFG